MKVQAKSANTPNTLADPAMQPQTASGEISPLRLLAQDDALLVEFRPPAAMPCYHWHGQVEINLPFERDVEYLLNGRHFTLHAGQIGLFWGLTPHWLVAAHECPGMGIINLPLHLFLTLAVDEQLVTGILQGDVIVSDAVGLFGEHEVRRWAQDSQSRHTGREQLMREEITLMLRRVGLLGWHTLLEGQRIRRQGTSYPDSAIRNVRRMLEYISREHDGAIKVPDVAAHTNLHPNYAMNLFKRVMRYSIKEYITLMKINHARALLSETRQPMLEIALTAGFNSVSRFYETFQRTVGMTPNQYRRQMRR